MKYYPQISYLDESRRDEIESFITEWYKDESTISVATSGSTGKPKLIKISKSKMLISAQKTILFLGLEKGTSCYLCLSCFTIAGKMMLVRAILNEMRIIVGPVSSRTLEVLHEKVEFAAFVPMQVQAALKNQGEKLKLIRQIIVGGAPVSKTLEENLKSEQLTVYQTFGMTETISHIALRKIGANQDEFYTGLEGVTFSIDKQERLIVHYPALEIERLETNDIVELHTNRSFKWLGRSDFAINSGGVKIIPEVIESKISQVIQLPFFIHGLPDSKLGQHVALFIEGSETDLPTLQLDQLLTPYEIPRSVYFLDRFSRTASDKVNRLETIKLIQS